MIRCSTSVGARSLALWGLLSLSTACTPSGPIDVSVHSIQDPSGVLDASVVLPIAFGAQGGFHTFVSLSLDNLVPGASSQLEGLREENLPQVWVEVAAPDGLLNQPHEESMLLEREGGGWTSGPLLVILQYYDGVPPVGFDPEVRQREIEDFIVTFSVEVEDARGGRGDTRAEARLAFP